ncbi:cyclopropane-fatty-acyl-phospholipid synthase family protein [Limnobacter humi]|uniref:Cyclopropane-fatty-acyl-phospholipid synthase family protein n=1 Tax=Limnobacter humi TaxID=1778671 RepID=A0ABT1WC19_9BURK|nr:cyclopropane-fatty-acyl-phospholipid synthase family protein [Limnobacter humi]MCQ8894914.1 cyclopropane-fatty-acyl-phospholipid synthase family protein [Limnobacter humi]
MTQAAVSLSQFQLPSHAPSAAQWTLKLLNKLKKGRLEMITPEGVHLLFGGEDDQPSARMTLHSWAVCSRALKSGDIGFAESYIAGEWETDNLAELLGVFLENRKAVEQVIYGSFLGSIAYKLKHLLNRNTKAQARKNIHAHYDLGNPFYQLWLDPSMTYSSALFDGNTSLSLEEAQQAKYQAMVDYLRPKAGETILEIGCGWGGFAQKVCSQGAELVGLTLSTEQLAYAKARLDRAGLGQHAEFRLQDYRDCKGQFDHIASIEMFEAVGEEYWSVYFETVSRLLKTGGKAAIQTITIADELFERYRKGTDFIQQYIFPGGMLPSPSKFRAMAERHGLRVVREKAFGKDYAETLRRWRVQFMKQLDAVRAQGFDQPFINTWEFYLAYCEAGFQYESTDVIQFYLEKAE